MYEDDYKTHCWEWTPTPSIDKYIDQFKDRKKDGKLIDW